MRRLLTLDLNLLVALDALLEEGSVTAAARRVGVTQPAMSHKLRRLREELGDPLFVSGQGGLVPTQRALEMAGPLRRALQDLARTVVGDKPFDPKTAKGRFVIATADLFEFTIVPYVLEFFGAEAPGAELVVEPQRDDMFARMERGEVHFAVGPRFPERAGLRRVKLIEETFAVIARAQHPLMRGRLTLAKYLRARHLLIAPRGRPGGIVDGVLSGMGKSRHVALQLGHFAPAPFIVARSDLLLTAPKALADEASKYVALVCKPVPLELPIVPYFMAWHERFDRDPAHRWFRDRPRRYLTKR